LASAQLHAVFPAVCQENGIRLRRFFAFAEFAAALADHAPKETIGNLLAKSFPTDTEKVSNGYTAFLRDCTITAP
jgi:hypothetical protein